MQLPQALAGGSRLPPPRSVTVASSSVNGQDPSASSGLPAPPDQVSALNVLYWQYLDWFLFSWLAPDRHSGHLCCIPPPPRNLAILFSSEFMYFLNLWLVSWVFVSVISSLLFVEQHVAAGIVVGVPQPVPSHLILYASMVLDPCWFLSDHHTHCFYPSAFTRVVPCLERLPSLTPWYPELNTACLGSLP